MGVEISDFMLERYVLGEVSDRERAMVESLMDEGVRARIDAIRASDREILERYPPSLIAASVRDRAGIEAEIPDESGNSLPNVIPFRVEGGTKARKLPWRKIVPAFAAACLVAVTLPVLSRGDATDGLPVSVRTKGDATIAVFRHGASGDERLSDGAKAREGDVIQLAYVSARRHGVLFSVDGRGSVTLHFPPSESASTELSSGFTHLGDAYRLDDAPAFEKFYLVASDDRLDAASVTDLAASMAVSGARAEDVFPGLELTSLTLVKE